MRKYLFSMATLVMGLTLSGFAVTETPSAASSQKTLKIPVRFSFTPKMSSKRAAAAKLLSVTNVFGGDGFYIVERSDGSTKTFKPDDALKTLTIKEVKKLLDGFSMAVASVKDSDPAVSLFDDKEQKYPATLKDLFDEYTLIDKGVFDMLEGVNVDELLTELFDVLAMETMYLDSDFLTTAAMSYAEFFDMAAVYATTTTYYNATTGTVTVNIRSEYSYGATETTTETRTDGSTYTYTTTWTQNEDGGYSGTTTSDEDSAWENFWDGVFGENDFCADCSGPRGDDGETSSTGGGGGGGGGTDEDDGGTPEDDEGTTPKDSLRWASTQQYRVTSYAVLATMKNVTALPSLIASYQAGKISLNVFKTKFVSLLNKAAFNNTALTKYNITAKIKLR